MPAEIGAASELNYRRPHPRALLFDEIAGYRPGRRVLMSSLSSPALMGPSLGLGPGLSDHDLVEALRGRPAGWAKAAASYPAEPADSGPVFDNVVVKGEIVDLTEVPVHLSESAGPTHGYCRSLANSERSSLTGR